MQNNISPIAMGNPELSGSQMSMRRGFNNPSELGATILSYLTAPRLLWIPNGTGAADSTEPDLSGQGNTMTYKGTHTMGTQGFAKIDTFDGTSAYGAIADSDTLSFGNGTNDSVMSVGCWINVYNAGSDKSIITKWRAVATATREWRLIISNSSIIKFQCYDQSVDKVCSRNTDSGVAAGYKLIVVTKDATGGATAMNNTKIYANNALVASTATNDVGYVAMENGVALPLIGAREATPATDYLATALACVFVSGEELSLATITNIYNSTRGYLGV